MKLVKYSIYSHHRNLHLYSWYLKGDRTIRRVTVQSLIKDSLCDSERLS